MPEPLTERARQLFDIFREAVQRERDAQMMYKQAMELCDDESLKKVLEDFCKDEARHERVLLERYAIVRKQYVAE